MNTKKALFLNVVIFLALISLGCQVLASNATPATVEPVISMPELTATDEPAVSTLEPPTPGRASDGDLQAEYTYTNNLVTALYHLYGTVLDDFVDITLTNSGSEPVTMIVQTEVAGYTTPALDTIEVDAGDSFELHQNPRLIPEAVDRLQSQKPGSFHIRVVYLENGVEKALLDETRQILIYSRRDFVWIPGFETHEEYELWAAWVTPSDPAVEELIRAAADYDPTGIMTSGYGDEPNDGDGSVWRRLKAIWAAESEVYRLTYISTMTTFAPGSVQRMRLPAEVLEQRGGNCVELAVLFASAAEALGLEAAIIRIPGHAYTAIRTDLENANYDFVETTMIGRASFAAAVNKGAEEWGETKPHLDAKEEGYAWVTIPIAREKGILPIPWR